MVYGPRAVWYCNRGKDLSRMIRGRITVIRTVSTTGILHYYEYEYSYECPVSGVFPKYSRYNRYATHRSSLLVVRRVAECSYYVERRRAVFTPDDLIGAQAHPDTSSDDGGAN
eukprot:scaffold205819_cov41-Prasinocladus_malaysianus.AAC.1